ncbi:MAG: homocysteine S-methyltransferase family protein [Dehalococcoidales bacterium]|nr:homocysteine S-methyltransferase family protein [Dehalococcoidales bacterium]
MRKNILDRLANGHVLVCHGAVGTMLQAAGDDFNRAPEMLNVRQPERVLAVQRAYIAAGAEVLSSFTFGASPIKLGRAGLAGEVAEVNRAAVQVARAAAGEDNYVAGALGPTGEILEPYGDLAEEEAVRSYAEQAAALAAAGADFFWVRTISDLAEARAAITGIREVSALPIFCTMTFDTGGRTMMGTSPTQAARTLADLGVAALGSNCGQGPEGMEAVLQEMVAACPGAVVIGQPNAGIPALEGGETVYDVGPETFGEYAARFAELGVKVVGGCCGSTPAHIAAITSALRR